MPSNILDGLRPLVVPIGAVRPMAGNPRRGDVESVAKSLKRFGQHRPIVVQRQSSEILIGNHTYKAAVSLGWDEIAVLYTDDDRETAVGRALADNRTHDSGTYDNEELAAMMAEANAADESLLADAGFDADEIDALLTLANQTIDEANAAVAATEAVQSSDDNPDDDESDEEGGADVEEIRVETVTAKERQATQFQPNLGDVGESHLFIGNCLDVMAEFPDKSIDSVITDPLGGITTERLKESDLGPGWWRWVPGPDFWKEIKRVLKPGGFCAIMAGTATWHKVAIAAEEGGLEMRDTLMWLYSHGMPMGIDIGMQVDKRTGGSGKPYFKRIGAMTDDQREQFIEEHAEDNPWYGWSTSLKPAWKPILLFRRKPTSGAAAASVIEHGVGAINIDACRVGNEERTASAAWINRRDSKMTGHGNEIVKSRVTTGRTTLGRWPSNVVADEEIHVEFGDSSRYFLCAGANKRERNAGLPPGKTNDQPKVRPVELMRWLVRLLTPPGGVVLDPFCGSGSTGVAATEEGMGFVGIDRNERWITDVAQYRLANVRAQAAQRKARSK